MEQEFMKKRNIKYVINSVVNLMHSGRDKGCLEMLASRAKSDATRRFFYKNEKFTRGVDYTGN